MIDPDHELPLTRQAQLLQLSRSGLYYRPRPVPPADLAIMRRIDELHLDHPFAGSRMLRDLLRGEGVAIGRAHVTTLMKRTGIEAVYRRPNTSKAAPGHKIYPYLLRGLAVERPNQAWAMDITYVPMARGFVYLAAVVDWFSRRVLSWRVSITMEVEFCLEAVEEALAKHGRPEIFNTDQGSQFTSAAFTGVLLDNAIAISMDGKGAWRDNVFVERLWRRSNTKRSTSRPTTASARHAPRSVDILTFTTASARIRALTPGRRIAPISTICRRSRQHEFRRRCRGVTPVGLRPPCVPSRQRQTTSATGRVPLIQRRNLSRQSRPAQSPPPRAARSSGAAAIAGISSPPIMSSASSSRAMRARW